MKSAMQVLLDRGVCVETVRPYIPTPIPDNISHGPLPKAVSDAPHERVSQTTRLSNRDAAAIRALLDEGTAVALSVRLFKSNNNGAAHVLGRIAMPLPDTSRAEGHAMCAVGYAIDFDGSLGTTLLSCATPGARSGRPVARLVQGTACSGSST